MIKVIKLGRRFVYLNVCRKRVYIEIFGLGVGVRLKPLRVWKQYLPKLRIGR